MRITSDGLRSCRSRAEPTVLTGSLDGRFIAGVEPGRQVALRGWWRTIARNASRVPVDGGPIVPLTVGEARRARRLCQVGPTAAPRLADRAGALRGLRARGRGGLRRCPRHNDAWLKGVRLATVEDFTTKAKDGTDGQRADLQAVVLCAQHEVSDRASIIHGGPNGQDEHEFDFAAQWMAANGYVVLQVNYRGSSGRRKYQKAIFGDWGNLEVVDLLAGVDWAIAQGIADPARLGIGGWSYGGILTNYTIATDPRFKAAVSGASSSLQTTMRWISTSSIRSGAGTAVEEPGRRGPRCRTRSSTPTASRPHALPLRREGLQRAVAGVEQMFQALRSLNIDTQLVIYPASSASLKPSYNRDRLQRYVAWFDKLPEGEAGDDDVIRGVPGLSRECRPGLSARLARSSSSSWTSTRRRPHRWTSRRARGTCPAGRPPDGSSCDMNTATSCSCGSAQ